MRKFAVTYNDKYQEFAEYSIIPLEKANNFINDPNYIVYELVPVKTSVEMVKKEVIV